MSTIIYSITHEPSGKRYIGATEKTVWRRWAEHVCALSRSTHSSPLFQALWSQSEITEWVFRLLEVIPSHQGTRARLLSEKKWIDICPLGLCLNEKRVLTSLDRRDQIIALLGIGTKQQDIARQVQLSVGMISRIKMDTFGYGKITPAVVATPAPVPIQSRPRGTVAQG